MVANRQSAGAQLTGRGARRRVSGRAWIAVAIACLGGTDAAAGGGQSVASPAPLPAPPRRIVSLNLCTDQLLMQLVPPGRIAALTYLARDPRYSGMVAEARRLAVTRGTAEEVIALRPDLVLAGPFSARETVALLRRLGYRVVSVDPANDFAGISRSIRVLAAAVGEPARGERMAEAIATRLAALPPAPPLAERPIFADYGANGFTSGSGALITAIADAAGFEMLGQRLGIAGTRQVSLEALLVAHPDLVALGDSYGAPALATQNYRHPALRHLLHETARIDLPDPPTACGTMQTLDALDRLVAARQRLR